METEKHMEEQMKNFLTKTVAFLKELAWDRIIMLSTAGVFLFWTDWRIGLGVALVVWALILAMNELIREQAKTDHNMAQLLLIHRGGLIEIMDRIKRLERTAGEEPPHVH